MNTSVISGEAPNGASKVVLIRRAGSGGCVVNPPNESWLRAVQLTNPQNGFGRYEPYTDFRVAIVPESEGYDNMPGCSIVIIPGDHESSGFRQCERVPLQAIPTTRSFLEHPVGRGMFGLSTNFEDLKALHAALGEVIASIEAGRPVAKG